MPHNTSLPLSRIHPIPVSLLPPSHFTPLAPARRISTHAIKWTSVYTPHPYSCSKIKNIHACIRGAMSVIDQRNSPECHPFPLLGARLTAAGASLLGGGTGETSTHPQLASCALASDGTTVSVSFKGVSSTRYVVANMLRMAAYAPPPETNCLLPPKIRNNDCW